MPITLTPAGSISYQITGDLAAEKSLAAAFDQSNCHGLIALASFTKSSLPSCITLDFWRQIIHQYLQAFARHPDVIQPCENALDLSLRMPAMQGAEYATPSFFQILWEDLNHFTSSASLPDPKKWLASINPAYHLLGKVTLHLAENKRTPDTPFAFLATYTHRLSASDKPAHIPLAQALTMFAGAKNQAALRNLLEPVQLASEQSKWMKDQLQSKYIFSPQAWTPVKAHAMLKEIPILEECGLMIRIPDWWKNTRTSRPEVTISIGDASPSAFGLSAMLDFQITTTLDGTPLTKAELDLILESHAGLIQIRGQWVEADPDKLRQALDHWQTISRHHANDGVSFLEAMRLLAGTRIGRGSAIDTSPQEYTRIIAGDWLEEKLRSLRDPAQFSISPPSTLRATLRHYQASGLKWLHTMHSLRLGACLADDMGLGKTIQIIALLLLCKASSTHHSPSLLIVPASLIGNWLAETSRFAPDLNIKILHPSHTPAKDWKESAIGKNLISEADLVITSYATSIRLPWLNEVSWNLLILDEAQAIKNPSAKQTQSVKKIPAHSRIALSGTPIENRLADLWSLYDFLNPGLLGSPAEFTRLTKSLQSQSPPDYSSLRRLIQPYILRRLKTDRSIIADLPDKTELSSFCLLSKTQTALYTANVEDLQKKLRATSEGIQRKGLVLSYLMRFKQLCNHPSQLLGDADYDPRHSGKFSRLSEICEEIASRQEKVLVFTQFREMTAPLAAHLSTIFGRQGLILHGGTAIKDRQKLVAQFQSPTGPPFFILSLKAGGTGLTLTAANHVIHFDRWWNPAVENQATDRAFRIGQKRNVLVHKFVCQGTVEEKIHHLIADKANLAESILDISNGAEKILTEMNDEELLNFVSLDIRSLQEI